MLWLICSALDFCVLLSVCPHHITYSDVIVEVGGEPVGCRVDFLLAHPFVEAEQCCNSWVLFSVPACYNVPLCEHVSTKREAKSKKHPAAWDAQVDSLAVHWPNAVTYTATGANRLTVDTAMALEGFQLFWPDRTTRKSGKKKGGGSICE